MSRLKWYSIENANKCSCFQSKNWQLGLEILRKCGIMRLLTGKVWEKTAWGENERYEREKICGGV